MKSIFDKQVRKSVVFIKNDFFCHSLPFGATGKNLTAHALVKVFRPVQDFKMSGAQFWVKEDGGKTNGFL